MKQILSETLDYPKVLLKDYLQMDSCPHSYLYNRHDVDCQCCMARPECEWLYKNESGANSDRPMQHLLQDLEFAVLSVQGHVARWEHDNRHCQCEACEWLKYAQRLYDMSKPLVNNA